MTTPRHSFLPPLHDSPGSDRPTAGPDRRDGAVYVADDDLRLAVDVALATGRPLLLRGDPGSGKSSLAGYLARNLGRRYYEHVVTARTTARDLLWTFDPVRKLADASVRDAGGADALRDLDYVEPGVLWWAFDRASARRRGTGPEPRRPAREPDDDLNAHRGEQGAVVLIDEIDKADPDLPNGLLVPLGSGEFVVTETGDLISATVPEADGPASNHLIVVTTNEERELPPAFLRRCVVVTLPPPGLDRLVAIAHAHVALDGVTGDGVTDTDDLLFRDLATRVLTAREEARTRGRRPPSTAEYLDAVHACRRLGLAEDVPDRARLLALVLDKSP
ncbi:AAA family ATPase [Actinomycetospora aeridis]|uniref:MoxR family ATPase n=1 Tax=Actinomycetospora aeridis TaxID=3129231 RepID=A0ABU8N275_9PSEU